MKLDIISRRGVIFTGQVSEVVVPAYEGEMGILPGHAPVLAVLVPGKVRYTTDSGQKNYAEISNGFMTVDSDNIRILVESGHAIKE